MKPLTPAQLRTTIQTALKQLNLYSADAEELLMATCAQESHLGEYRRQLGNGPAMGIYQMEPATFNDIQANYLAYKPSLAAEIAAFASTCPPRPVELIANDAFATAMARTHYLRAPEALPPATDLGAIWNLYKLRWNTPAGAATEGQFRANYARYVTDGAAK
jgi:hypothetical protein